VIEITTDLITIKIYDEFKVDIYNKEGKLICEDYRGKREPFVKNCAGRLDIAMQEGHKPNEHMDYNVFVPKKKEDNMYFYGFGERSGHLNKKDCHYVNWNTDDPSPHGETYEKLYKSIPFFITLKDEEAFGIFFDNTFEAHFDLGKENSNYYYFASIHGNLDYYFIYGPSVKEVIKGYTNLTGTTPLPQLWTLGYQQCRWAYCPEENVMDIARKFREKDIPCDTLYLDIEYMDGFRVFTWDNEKFKNPKNMIDNLKNDGFKLVTIIDPGVKVDKGYSVYDEGLKNNYYATNKDGIPHIGWVWPGHSVFPDFMNSEVRNWWASNQRIMMDYGVAGIWNDMNEPANLGVELPLDLKFDRDGEAVEHKEVHNVYGHMMDKATYEGIKNATNKRPFVVTRACYSGTQKYSTVWTGDNQSTWEHLRMSVPMLMNLGLSGMAFCGTDVGGFGYDCTPELLSRWVQVGAFTPLFRNHTTIYSRDQEPWAFDKTTEDINRKYIKLRYKLIPYLYDILQKGEVDGLPVMRALLLHYQNDINTYEINDQFMFGENIIVAPVLEQGKKARMVYLPKGHKWIDYWTKEVFEGGCYIVKQTPLDVCPIYIKEGSIVPNYPEMSYIGEKEVDILKLDVYLTQGISEYIHYQDNGENFNYRDGEYNLYKFKLNCNDNIKFETVIEHNGYNKLYSGYEIRFNNIEANYACINGEEAKFEVSDGSTIIVVKDINAEITIN
ncbi:MAG: TIM-barrel domain-containing protein, partial [Paraclostridium sp.]